MNRKKTREFRSEMKKAARERSESLFHFRIKSIETKNVDIVWIIANVYKVYVHRLEIIDQFRKEPVIVFNSVVERDDPVTAYVVNHATVDDERVIELILHP